MNLLATLLTLALPATSADTTLCARAAAFVRTASGMVAIVEPDTFDDWRTRQLHKACRVTAAGRTRLTPRDAAAQFYERLRSAGWVRTPDPQDAPNEASLRFRTEGVDCLFNVSPEALLFTDAESRVLEAVVPREGERRLHAVIVCIRALPAARGAG